MICMIEDSKKMHFHLGYKKITFNSTINLQLEFDLHPSQINFHGINILFLPISANQKRETQYHNITCTKS